MLRKQKKLLAQAELEHLAAVERTDAAREALKRHRHSFLGKPLNLLYPFAAGVLVCAGQSKSDTKGAYRIPFFNLAKIAIGVWVTAEKIKKVRIARGEQRRSANQ